MNVWYLNNHQLTLVESLGGITLKEEGYTDNMSIVVWENTQCIYPIRAMVTIDGGHALSVSTV